jgi:hypothetical protein
LGIGPPRDASHLLQIFSQGLKSFGRSGDRFGELISRGRVVFALSVLRGLSARGLQTVHVAYVHRVFVTCSSVCEHEAFRSTDRPGFCCTKLTDRPRERAIQSAIVTDRPSWVFGPSAVAGNLLEVLFGFTNHQLRGRGLSAVLLRTFRPEPH